MSNLICRKCQSPLFLENCIKCSPEKKLVENIKFQFCKDYRDSIVVNDTWNGAFAVYFCITIFLWAAWFLTIFISGGILILPATIILVLIWVSSLLVFGFAPLAVKRIIILFAYENVFKLFRPPIIESPPIIDYDSIFPEKIYVFSHPSMPDVVKIGRTKIGIIEKFFDSFTSDTSSIFKIEATISTPDCCELEKLINILFDDHRINSLRGFFRIDKNIFITKSNELNEVLISKHYTNIRQK